MARIIKDSIITFFTRIIILVISLIFNIIISRLLGPSLRGSYSIITMIFGFSVLLFLFGLGSANVYYGARKPNDIPYLAGNSLIIGLSLGFIGVFFIEISTYSPVFIQYLTKTGVNVNLIRIATFLLPVGLLIAYQKEIIRAAGKILQYNIVTLCEYAIALAFAILFYILYNLKLYEAVWIFAISKIATLVLITILVLHIVRFKLKYNWKRIQECFSFGIRLYPGNLAQFLNSRLDVFFISLFLTPLHVGLYTTAVLLSERILEIPNAIRTVLLYHIAGADDTTAANIKTTRLCRVVFSLTGIICLVVGFLSYPIMSLLFGSEYTSAAPALIFLLPGIWILSIGKLLAIHVAGSGHPQIATYGAIISLISTIILDVLLIPKLGIIGASIASSIAYSIATFVILTFFLRITRLSVKDVLLLRFEDINSLKSYFHKWFSQPGRARTKDEKA